MIILDFGQTIFSQIFVDMGRSGKNTVEIDFLRHLVLNTLRTTNKKFRKEYGEMVIAVDSSNNWRRRYFPEYKASRATGRAADDKDWGQIFDAIDTVVAELDEYFPFHIVKVDTAEADDIIAVLVEHLPAEEKKIIISGDKDFKQLQIIPNVRQWCPRKKAFIKVSDPELSQKELIYKGDSGDGVPNILSDDDALVNPDKRQAPMTKKRIQYFRETPYDQLTIKERINWDRNQMMTSICGPRSGIPDDVKEEIIQEWKSVKKDSEDRGMSPVIHRYMMENELFTMMDKINDFQIAPAKSVNHAGFGNSDRMKQFRGEVEPENAPEDIFNL